MVENGEIHETDGISKTDGQCPANGYDRSFSHMHEFVAVADGGVVGGTVQRDLRPGTRRLLGA